MKKIVLAVTGASAQVLAERAIGLLLKNNYSIDLILSKGAYNVWQSALQVKVPLEPSKQELFWRNRLHVDSGGDNNSSNNNSEKY